jgi:DNA-binding transcriptional MocR family regulator
MGSAAVVLPSEHLYQQLADELSTQIEAGRLRPGERLPSVRRTSRQRGVSVSTVVQAYQLLEGRGLVEARPQSGHYVRPRPRLDLLEPRAPRVCTVPTRVSVQDQVARVYRAMRDPRVVPLGAAIMSPALLPTEKLSRIMASMARSAGPRGLAYEPPPGARELRRQLSRRSMVWGAPLAADEFVITVGAMEALSLAVRAVTHPGDAVAVESPAYYGMLQLLESLELRAFEVPTGANGMDLGALESALKQHRIRAVLTVTNFSNPSGALMPDDAKEALVHLLKKHEVPLIEDDIYGDLQHDGERPRPAKAWDTEGLVLLCGSFSKTLAPGLRVGFISPGRYQSQIEHLKFTYSVGTPTLPQLAVAEFLEGGGYEHHLRGVRRRLVTQVSSYRAAIAEFFPSGTRVSCPQGGHVLWVELPNGCDSTELARRALDAGIGIAEGTIFSARGRFRNFVRLNAGYPFDAGMEQALNTLGALASPR